MDAKNVLVEARPERTTRAVHACIVCGENATQEFLDLGNTPLANKFLSADELQHEEKAYPLRVGFCHACSHVQLTERVPPQAMFEDYLYMSSASDTLKNHLYDLSDVVLARYNLGGEDLVVDIGCNDGTLLTGFRRHGVRTLGVDPAANLAELTRGNGIERYVGFFNSKSAREILQKNGPAAAITATNTFPHIPALQDFMTGIKTLLAPGGVFVIEAHYLVDMIEQGAFDTIYHEHVSYWALRPMIRVFDAVGMEVVDVERLPLHHGQIRVFVQRKGEGRPTSNVAELLKLEDEAGLSKFETYRRFGETTQKIKSDLLAVLTDFRAHGKTIAGYGAPAKGNTLLSFLEIGPDLIPYIADKSRLKQGLYSPGSHIPIVEPETLLANQPDYILLLAWNFADEIMEQQREYRRRGGRFVLPVPTVRVI